MNDEDILGKLVFRTQVEIDSALQKHFGCGLWRLKNVDDQLRLVVFRVWADKYHIPIDEVVQIVVSFYREFFAKKLKKAPIFGATISTVTGQHAERVLAETLKKKYPEGENETNWLQSEKDRQLLLLERATHQNAVIQTITASADEVKNFIRNYSEFVKQRQVKSIRPLTLRRYRNCPW